MKVKHSVLAIQLSTDLQLSIFGNYLESVPVSITTIIGYELKETVNISIAIGTFGTIIVSGPLNVSNMSYNAIVKWPYKHTVVEDICEDEEHNNANRIFSVMYREVLHNYLIPLTVSEVKLSTRTVSYIIDIVLNDFDLLMSLK